MAIEHRAVPVGDLAGVVQHDHLGGEVGNAGGRLVLGVGSDVASPDSLFQYELNFYRNNHQKLLKL